MIRFLTLVVTVSLLALSLAFAADEMQKGKEMMEQGKEMMGKGSQPKTLTILSEPVDPACYMRQGLKGEGHKACAEACHKAGQSLALLSDDGSLFYAIGGKPEASPDEQLVPFIGTKVKVTGKVFESGGAKAMVVEKVEPVK
ncbi:MAG: hypothetical protein ACM3SR_05160 [Ignavibacteriales bacterium]|jgi:hypothetical protein